MIKDSIGICDAIRSLCSTDCRECTPGSSRLKSDNGFCRVCMAEQLKKYGAAKCADIERFAFYQAERWGGSYEFLCPAGCAFTCSLLSRISETALLAGPFLMVERDDFLQNDLQALIPLSGPVASAAAALPCFDVRQVPALTDILFSLCAHLGRQSRSELEAIELDELHTRKAYENMNPGIYPVYKERQLRMHMAKGDRDSAGRIINELLGNIYFESGVDPETIRTRITEIAVELSRGAMEGGADAEKVLRLNSEYLPQLAQLKDTRQLSYWLAHMLVMYSRCVFNARGREYSKVVLDIMNYIRKNFGGKLTLNEIADSVCFSVSYVSRIFKSETGESISAYINRIRIEYAKAALTCEDTPLVELAMECGFDDQSYFSKVFKKFCGCTPTEFRQSNGNLYRENRNGDSGG